MSKNLLKVALLTSAVSLSATAGAAEFYIANGANYDSGDVPDDVGVNGSNSNTGSLQSISFQYISSSTLFDTNGSGFVDAGDVIISSMGTLNSVTLNPEESFLTGGPDDNGFNVNWGLAFDFTSIVGQVGPGGIFFGGGIIDFSYGDIQNLGATQVFDLDLAFGAITLGEQFFVGEVNNFSDTALTQGGLFGDLFRFTANDTSFRDAPVLWRISQTLNTEATEALGLDSTPLLDLIGDAYDGSGQITLAAVHDGSITFTVPEPASIALFGLGLLGIGALKRKKS